NVVQGNLIGTDKTGLAALGNHIDGVMIQTTATNNTIGGTSLAARNVISGNTSQGVEISDSATTGNVIAGNFIGLASNGTSALGNGGQGVYVHAGAQNNTIGGTAAGAGNVISANAGYGVELLGSTTSTNVTGTLIAGNLIGTNAAGTSLVS